MPNKEIYLNTINEIEKEVGVAFIDRHEMAKQLQDAWKNDPSEGKVNYLDAYRKVFSSVLAKFSDHAFFVAFKARSDKMADLKNSLLKTEKLLKTCAMALIPELRENEDALSNMTFGVLTPERLKNEFFTARKKYLNLAAPKKAMEARKADAYKKYGKEWLKTTVRKIAELVRDKEALQLMSLDEKLDYVMALDTYRKDPNLNPPLGEGDKDLLDDAVKGWEQEFNCSYNDIEELVMNQHFQYAQGQFAKDEWVAAEIDAAIAEYNKTPTPAKQEIAQYKETVETTAQLNKLQDEVTMEEAAVSLGDFFIQEELKVDIEQEGRPYKEYAYLEDKVKSLNEQYSTRVNVHKVRTTVEQLSRLMIQAREEKERFLSKDNVVVIENNEEKCYSAKEYYKDVIENANKAYLAKVTEIEKEREAADKDYKKIVNESDRMGADEDTINATKKDAEKVLKKKTDEINKKLEKAKQELKEELDTVKGGIVIEKSGDAKKEYKSSQYYETHETKNEQYVYGQYQFAFAKIYKEASKNLKEQNYAQGKETDFSKIANDVDRLFKSAMYVTGVYENEKNAEIIQKCSFGSFSAEKLESFVSRFDDDSWAFNQTEEKLWSKQVSNAKKILTQWDKEEVDNPKVKPSDRIKKVLDEKCAKFKKGDITKKEMLDYMVAAQGHILGKYPSNWSRFVSFRQFNRVKNSLNECRKAMGLTEKSSLRIAMINEYTRLANRMSKEEVFKSIRMRMNNAPSFKLEKQELEKEHQVVKDRVIVEKKAKLEELKANGREPISIPKLDPRNEIVNGQPRVKPIMPPTEVKKDLNLAQ
jgi:hypothetical protein